MTNRKEDEIRVSGIRSSRPSRRGRPLRKTLILCVDCTHVGPSASEYIPEPQWADRRCILYEKTHAVSPFYVSPTTAQHCLHFEDTND